MDDWQLMLRVRDGDETAFNRLVTRHRDRVVGFVYRITGDSETAEDLAQETFLRIYQARDRVEPMAQFTTWLYRIATNLAISHLRRSRRRGTGFQPLPELAAADPTPDEALELQETRRRVWEALDALPPNQRTALVLTRFEECSYAEAAEVMKITIAALRSLVSRARETLRERLRDTLTAPVQREAIT